MEKERDQIACKADNVMADYEHEKQEKFAIKVHKYYTHTYTCIYIIHICIIHVYVYNMIHHLLYFHNVVLTD